MGVAFIQSSESVPFPVEVWTFIADFVRKKGMFIHGPFKKSWKHIQIHFFLGINTIQIIGREKVIQFATQEQFKIFDSLFG